MRFLGIDYGDKYIGMAISDPLKLSASPIGEVRYSSLDQAFSFIKEQIDKNAPIEKIILGLPKSLKKTNNLAENKVRDFGSKLKEWLGIEVIFIDERFTTVMARKASKNKRVDSVAAAIILQAYLDSIK